MTSDDIFRGFLEYFEASLELVAGRGIAVSPSTAKTDFAAGSLWWKQSCTVDRRAAWICAGAEESLWKQIGSPGDDDASLKELFFEALSQAALRILDDVQRNTGVAMVGQQSGATATPPAIGESFRRVSVRDDGVAAGDFIVIIDPLLIANTVGKKERAENAAREETQKKSLSSLNAALTSVEGATGPMASRLLDLSLPVSIRIAQTVMPIKDVLRLTPGSVVELGKYAGEPVDIVVHGAVLARGSVVSVKGYYGVKITEIVEMEERLAVVGPQRADVVRAATVLSA